MGLTNTVVVKAYSPVDHIVQDSMLIHLWLCLQGCLMRTWSEHAITHIKCLFSLLRKTIWVYLEEISFESIDGYFINALNFYWLFLLILRRLVEGRYIIRDELTQLLIIIYNLWVLIISRQAKTWPIKILWWNLLLTQSCPISVFVSKEFQFKRMSHTSGIDQIIVVIYLDFQKW